MTVRAVCSQTSSRSIARPLCSLTFSFASFCRSLLVRSHPTPTPEMYSRADEMGTGPSEARPTASTSSASKCRLEVKRGIAIVVTSDVALLQHVAIAKRVLVGGHYFRRPQGGKVRKPQRGKGLYLFVVVVIVILSLPNQF